ncbi:YfcE family phosphodiesterase [Senegalia sp. (in: firmicutes)]|uniref:YfcE family phosphodiesterase n=2 Tax=Senegalia sp. (in: firmicutes) TaxID=1924098 RepID=UPI003F94B383
MNSMKILVLSDSHGDIEKIEEIIKIINSSKDIDMIIHLGDFAKDAIYIKNNISIEMKNILGNCDFLIDRVNEEEILNINDKKILLTHGHKYNIKDNLNNLYYRAKELNLDLILFGHIHKPINFLEENILLFNPGSISEPRDGSRNSYGIIRISDIIKGEIVEI